MTVLKKKVILTSAFVFLLAMAVLASIKLVNVGADSNKVYPTNKYYTSYEIQPGDTLISIAKKYTKDTDVSVDDYIEEVKKNNNISTDKITSGKNLIIAYYSFESK